jgi:hypothetical protein
MAVGRAELLAMAASVGLGEPLLDAMVPPPLPPSPLLIGAFERMGGFRWA